MSIVCHGCTLRLDRAWFNDSPLYLSELCQSKVHCKAFGRDRRYPITNAFRKLGLASP